MSDKDRALRQPRKFYCKNNNKPTVLKRHTREEGKMQHIYHSKNPSAKNNLSKEYKNNQVCEKV